MEPAVNLESLIERRTFFHKLYKIYYIENKKYIVHDSHIILRDKIIKNKYKSIHEIIYINDRPIIKKIPNCSFKHKLIHHLTYFYMNKINKNDEVVSILKGDYNFLYKSLNYYKKNNSIYISISEYTIIYEIIEKISFIINKEIKI